MTNSENIPHHVSLFSEAGLKSQDLKYIYIYILLPHNCLYFSSWPGKTMLKFEYVLKDIPFSRKPTTTSESCDVSAALDKESIR